MATAAKPGLSARATVLVVDDESLLRMTARHHLVEAGFEVLEASGAHEALALHAGSHGAIDLLLTDVLLTAMTGRELAERVRSEDPRVTVVYMSAYPEEHLVEKGRLPAGTRLLQKPFAPEALLETVRQAIGA